MKRKSRDIQFDWGHTKPGLKDSAFSCGPTNTYCNIYKSCTEEKVRFSYDRDAKTAAKVVSGAGSSGHEWFASTRRKKPHFNNCDHFKSVGLNHPYGCVAIREYGTRTGIYACVPTFDRVSVLTRSLPYLEKHPSLDISAAQRTAWHTMQEEFEGNISLINFIYELKDFRDIIKFARKQPLRKIGNYMRRFWGKLKKGKFDPTLPLAQAHLANEFAIKPLISDLVAIHKQLYDVVMDAQNEFKLAGMAGNTRHYSETFTESQPITPIYKKWYGDGFYEQTRFTATLDYSFTYECRSFFRAAQKYWGLEFTAEALWNMMPFSFLLDYVYSVGKTVSIMEHDKNVRTFVNQYCESLLTTKSDGYHIDCDSMASPVIINNHFRDGVNLLSGSQTSLYTRRVTAPNKGTVLPRVKAPSFMQSVNSAALLRVLL